MSLLRNVFVILLLCPLFATFAHAQTGTVFSNAGPGGNFSSPYGEPTFGNTHIYVLGLAGDTRFGSTTSLIDCSLVGVSGYNVYEDSNSNCYVLSDSSGNFGLTGTYHQDCVSDSQIVYFEAVGGDVGGTANPYLALIAVPPSLYTCGYIYSNSSSISISISDFTNAIAAFTAGTFALYGAGNTFDVLTATYNSANEAAVGAAFDAANNVVPISTGVYGGTNSTVQYQLNTVADVVASCIASSNPTTDCGTLFSNTMLGNFTRTAPVNTWEAMLSMAQDSTDNVTGQYALIASTPPWAPYYSTAPTSWTITQSSTTPYIGSITLETGGPGRHYLIMGTELADCTNYVYPTVVYDGSVATVDTSGVCSNSQIEVDVSSGGHTIDVMGLYLEGDFSNFIIP